MKDLTEESQDIESYTVPVVADFVQVPPNPNIVVLKNNLGEMRKQNRPCIIRFHKISILKSPEEYYLRILQLYLPWRDENDLKHNATYATKYGAVESDILDNIKRHEPYLHLDYDDLYNHQTLELDDDDDNDDDNHEIYMLNPNLVDYNDEDPPGQAHIGSVAPAIINNITYSPK